MKKLSPSRTWSVLFGFGAFLVFMLGAAAWHTLIDGNSLDCSFQGVVCLFIPDFSDWYIHLISYALIAPLLVAMVITFRNWRNQWIHLKMLTSNLATLAIADDKLETLARKLNLEDKLYLLDSDDYISFCACFLSPRIYISRALTEKLTAEELEALLLHEKYHLENRDPLRIFLGQLIVSGLFFIPILKDLFKRYLIRKEIAADQHAISYQGNRHGIASSLQKLMQRQSIAGSTGLAVSGTEALKYRIDYMLGRPDREQTPLSHLAISLLMPLFIVGCILVPILILRS